ncbi:reductase [Kitasatospora herbaricolor]|uniref:NAD-dependent epimerase/dehydratase family protein n=1 Tax=Kitasatospora herbaricolor TaxID=68217 RepID=UPI00174B0C64|nr:NAD-dependent epimerase/dehydratase family protein [Kitasatospora herbaricolor]MDQ0310476.1 nucleoside-diphosphate-sugar epimerase [Kitasatospora herbaricolor]GGV07557.1 reductase [Kitasatospora herbaricolor]
MRVLLLGADGFIGRRVTDRLLVDQELQVTVLGRRDSADIRFDLTTGSPGALARFLDAVAPQVVINCAGATYGSSRVLIRSNTLAVATVCEAIRRSREPARLVHVGSAAEYGPVPGGIPIAESAEPRPVGPYGVSKLAGTELVLSSGLDATVLRVFDVVGPGAPTASLFGRLSEGLRRALERDESVVRMPDLSGYRDFVDVRDVARAIQSAAVSAATGVINIGSGHAVRARDAAQMLVRTAGFEGTVAEESRPALLPAQSAGAADHLLHPLAHHLAGHRAAESRTGEGRAVDGRSPAAEPVPWRQADVRTARDRLGWRTQVPLEESLGDIWLETACRV